MCWNDEENLDFMGVENVTRLQFINQFNEELELHIMRHQGPEFASRLLRQGKLQLLRFLLRDTIRQNQDFADIWVSTIRSAYNLRSLAA